MRHTQFEQLPRNFNLRSIITLLALTISTSALHAQVTQTDEAHAAFTLGKKALEQNDASKAVEFLEKAVAQKNDARQTST